MARVHSDCLIGQAVNDSRFAGTDNTPPFRFRRWMFTQTGWVGRGGYASLNGGSAYPGSGSTTSSFDDVVVRA